MDNQKTDNKPRESYLARLETENKRLTELSSQQHISTVALCNRVNKLSKELQAAEESIKALESGLSNRRKYFIEQTAASILGCLFSARWSEGRSRGELAFEALNLALVLDEKMGAYFGAEKEEQPK